MDRRNVAVIGAGAGGLAAALELRREGHSAVIFEAEDQVGGTWVYSPSTESDHIGIDPSRTVIHSSIYASLRTNLPREVMGFRDYPFVATNKPHRDPRRYPGHEEVLEYLKDYATEHGKHKFLMGIDVWPGKQIHSHNYRVPESFRDQVCYYLSGGLEIRINRDSKKTGKIESVREEGTVIFQDGSEICANIILHCTGYKYHFPFLKTSNIVTVDDNRVGPLYKHIFLPSLAPWLSFVGLPWKVVFPLG